MKKNCLNCERYYSTSFNVAMLCLEQIDILEGCPNWKEQINVKPAE